MSAEQPVVDPGGVVAIIPARGGSQGIPRKNLTLLAGRPLIAYTIEAARACPYIDRVIVSTDDEEIAQAAREWGAEVPFLRPAQFASSTSSLRHVLDHALDWLRETDGWQDRAWGVLYPTSPFRTARLVSDVFRPVAEGQADTSVSVIRHRVHPSRHVLMSSDGCLAPVVESPGDVYQTVGSISCSATKPGGRSDRMVIIESETLLMDVDGPEDLVQAERIIAEGRWSWEDLHVHEGVSLA